MDHNEYIGDMKRDRDVTLGPTPYTWAKHDV